jgi:hypothetical protein
MFSAQCARLARSPGSQTNLWTAILGLARESEGEPHGARKLAQSLLECLLSFANENISEGSCAASVGDPSAIF